MQINMSNNNYSRRSFLTASAATVGLSFLAQREQEVTAQVGSDAPISPKDEIKITKLEPFLVKPRWLFLKIHTDAGIVGLGEPILEGRAETCKTAVEELSYYLIGKDPRKVTHHWQAIYRHAFYRGGPILTSVLSGIDQALWDIKGKALGVPVYELLGGPTRDKVRVYGRARRPEDIQRGIDSGFNVFKTGTGGMRPSKYIATMGDIERAADSFGALREAAGKDIDIAIDFHGAVQPQTAMLLVKALEEHQPFFIEEPVQCQNVEAMAEIAHKTHIPIATGERIFTKWGFREILEKKAASVIQPDLCHAGGITEVRLIAGMAEAYYIPLAPHNPLGPISLASGMQIAASIPNFLVQEQSSLGVGYLKEPFVMKEGYTGLPTKPGLGVELDDDLMEDKYDHDWKNPMTYDEDDGSVIDW